LWAIITFPTCVSQIEFIYYSESDGVGSYSLSFPSICPADLQCLEDGTYQVEVTDVAGLTGSAEFTVEVNNPIECGRLADSVKLVELYYETGGANWTNTWDLTQPIDDWYGVFLDQNGCVIGLHLPNNNLQGSIPSELGDLSSLRGLNLSSNQLSGSIPPEIGNLTNLFFLYLDNNQLNGSIPPEIRNLKNLSFLWLYNNRLSGVIPDFSTLTYPAQLYIWENKFSIQDIETNYDSNNSFFSFQYSPQYYGEVQSYIVEPDTSLTLSLSTPLPGNNNQNVSYQWKKNGANLISQTNSTLALTNIQPDNVGKYTLHMTDPTRIPDLEVISEPIYVVLPGYDLYGQPVIYNQIIIEFDNEADKLEYEEKYVHIERVDLAAQVKDSCACNRLLYLWDFPNDSIAFQSFLEINTKKQSQTTRGEIDGEFNNILGIGPIPGTQGWTWIDDYPHNYTDPVSVFLLDSGVDEQNWNATPFLLNAAPVDACYEIPLDSGYDYADTLSAIQGGFTDSIGHGTFGMRSIAEHSDAYMDMKVVPLKVFDKNGRGTLFNFICALYHAIDHDADIINISAGYSGQPSDILEEAIALAHSKGQFIVAATGNEGVNIDSFPQYPAYYAKPFYKTNPDGVEVLIHYDNVISVAAIDAMGSLWQYSNYGEEAATISAYGENMGGYSYTGEEVSYSGTSISTYYVTRQLAAEIARDKTRSLQDIWAEFEANYLRDCPATDGLTSTGKCLDISLREVYSDLLVVLEGAFDTLGDTMRTDLNTLRHFLPGQTDSTFNRTIAIQPYGIAPFDYYGTEAVPTAFDNYPVDVVDWVLISARTEIAPSSTVSRTAAWLLKNGRVQLLKPLFEDVTIAPDSVYIVIEHRNHMGIMSPQKIPVERNLVTWDFTQENSYTTSTGVGQKILGNLYWGMLAGDTNQDLDGYDINGDDKGFWVNDNGQFSFYLPTDFNMDGDVNGQDKIFWENNNGKFSGVLRY